MVRNVSLIAIELNSSHGIFSSIAIELKVDGQRALNIPTGTDKLLYSHLL